MPFLRFPLNRGKALIRHYASSSEKSHVCLRCSVVNALATLRLHYQLFSAKRSSRWSERRRSELLFEKNVRLRASFLCFTFYMRLRRSFIYDNKAAVPLPPKGTTSGQMTFLRFPLNRGKALICHCPSSSEKSHLVAPNAALTLFA